MKPPRFELRREETPSPSFNVGWRLGVCFGAAAVLMVYTATFVVALIGVWDVSR